MIGTTKVFRINPKRSRKVERVLALLLVAPLVMLAAFAFQYEMLGNVLADPVIVGILLFMPVVLVPAIWANHRYSATARLTVDAQGLRMQSGLWPILGLDAWRSWECRWDEITGVSVIEQFGLVQIRRKGFVVAPIPLRITDWIEDVPGADTAAHSIQPSAMRTTLLWKMLEEAGLFAEEHADGRLDALNFDLAKHPATKATLVVSGVSFAYGALDSLLGREAWADWRLPYLMPHVFVGAIATAIAVFALRAARKPRPVPVHVVVPLAVMLGLVSGSASWSGLIRVNQLVGGPLVEQAYVRNEACDTLLPVKDGLPPIEYTELAKDYWCKFPIEQRHLVPVRKGLGGLYQVDLTRHTEAIREFRQSRRH